MSVLSSGLVGAVGLRLAAHTQAANIEVGWVATRAVCSVSTRKPSGGAAGFFISIGRLSVAAMERRASLDNALFELIRSGSWHYGSLKADRLPQLAVI